MEHIRPEGLFIFTAAVHVVILGYTVYRMTVRLPPDRTLREAFRGAFAPRTATPESMTLDPRANVVDQPPAAVDPALDDLPPGPDAPAPAAEEMPIAEPIIPTMPPTPAPAANAPLAETTARQAFPEDPKET